MLNVVMTSNSSKSIRVEQGNGTLFPIRSNPTPTNRESFDKLTNLYEKTDANDHLFTYLMHYESKVKSLKDIPETELAKEAKERTRNPIHSYFECYLAQWKKRMQLLEKENAKLREKEIVDVDGSNLKHIGANNIDIEFKYFPDNTGWIKSTTAYINYKLWCERFKKTYVTLIEFEIEMKKLLPDEHEDWKKDGFIYYNLSKLDLKKPRRYYNLARNPKDIKRFNEDVNLRNIINGVTRSQNEIINLNLQDSGLKSKCEVVNLEDKCCTIINNSEKCNLEDIKDNRQNINKLQFVK